MKTNALSDIARRTREPAISWLMKMALEQPDLISLAAGFTDNASLPVDETRAALQRLYDSPRFRPSLQYGPTQGDPDLRRLTTHHLEKSDARALAHTQVSRGAYAPERLIITHGSQQLLYLVTEALCNPGDIVIVEDPTYFVYLEMLQSRAVATRGIRMTPDGLDLAHLESVLEKLKSQRLLHRVKIIYLVSYFQNPTGITTVAGKKEEVLNLLARYEKKAGHPIYLVEDAAYRELRFDGAEEPSALAAKRGVDRVIYAGTYSKPFATGIRNGFGILPHPIFDAVLRLKGNHDFGTSHLLQAILREVLSSGEYESHLGILRDRYARKARLMTQAIEKHFPANVQWAHPRGGLYVWAKRRSR